MDFAVAWNHIFAVALMLIVGSSLYMSSLCLKWVLSGILGRHPGPVFRVPAVALGRKTLVQAGRVPCSAGPSCGRPAALPFHLCSRRTTV